jgi:hypothetical protein
MIQEAAADMKLSRMLTICDIVVNTQVKYLELIRRMSRESDGCDRVYFTSGVEFLSVICSAVIGDSPVVRTEFPALDEIREKSAAEPIREDFAMNKRMRL